MKKLKAITIVASLVLSGIAGDTVAARATVAPRSTATTVVRGFFPGVPSSTATGVWHSCAILDTGTYCWGNNQSGELGDGTTTNSSSVVRVTGGALEGRAAIAVAAGHGHTCAIVDSDSDFVACWGLQIYGMMGKNPAQNCFDEICGNAQYSTAPRRVTGGALDEHTPTAITAGTQFNCVLLENGKVACWGYNPAGQLGNGVVDPTWETYSDTPEIVSGGALDGHTATAVAAGAGHVCAIRDDGQVACWGYNETGQLGNGTTVDSSVPVLVSGGAMTGRTAVAIATGFHHTCAIRDDGGVACWGQNTTGQLGNAWTIGALSSTPVQVIGDTITGHRATRISAGLGFSCASLSNGSLVCWGYNEYGQLGDGTTTNSAVPVLAAPNEIAGHSVVSQGNGYDYTCALLDDGANLCWGMNFYGQLGAVASAGVRQSDVRRSGVHSAGTDPTGAKSAIWKLTVTNKSGTPARRPGQVRSLVARARKASVSLSWNSPSFTYLAPVAAYRVEYSRDAKRWVTYSFTKSKSVTVLRLRKGVKYLFRVRAVNSLGAGLATNVVTARPT